MLKTQAHHNAKLPGKTVTCTLIWLILSALSPRSGAGDLIDFQLSDNGGEYSVRVVMAVYAPARYVRAVLTDYTHIYRLNPSITESGILPSPQPGVARVRTLMQGCVLFFCRDIERVEDVRELKSGDLQADVVPALSNFRSGHAKWVIQQMGKISRVTYEGSMQPDFFIPPIIGSFFVKRNIGKEVMSSFRRLECVARARAQLDRQPYRQVAADGIPAVACAGQCDDSNPGCLK